MKVLFIGGNGNISWYCTETAINLGQEVWELNRGISLKTRRPIQQNVHKLTGNIRNVNEINELIKDLKFDVVCDFLCFNEEHAKNAIKMFENKTKQYIYVSTESVFKRAKGNEPYNEKSPKYEENEACSYIDGKLKAENVFLEQYKSTGFPLTIVRPGYTLDTILPYSIGHNCFTVAKRYLDGNPILIAGDGNNIWTFTHSSDFANAFCKLFGNSKTIGEDYNIIGDERLTWREILTIFAKELKNVEPNFLYIPYNDCLKLTEFMPEDLMKQRMGNAIFDNSKIKELVLGWKSNTTMGGAIKQTLNWLHEDKVRIRINPELNEKLENLTEKYMELENGK